MTRLIEQMLTLARIEQAGVTYPERVDLTTVLQSIIASLQAQADERCVALLLPRLESSPLCVEGNEGQLRQVFFNLVENAIKYAEGRVTIAAECKHETISVTVGNTGAPIAPEHLPHLFERFYRADSARVRDTGGFGLGLAIAAAIAKVHRGQIQVVSESGTGTTVIVTLPIPANHWDRASQLSRTIDNR